MSEAAFALNPDGTACDPVAFQTALRQDEGKLHILRKEPETLAVMLGKDVVAVQSMLRSAFQVRRLCCLTASLSAQARSHRRITCRRSKLESSDSAKGFQSVP